MNAYQYVKPPQLTEALRLMRENPDCHLLAGGTDLLVRMKLGRLQPGLLLDVSQLPELRTIREEAGLLRIGAAVTHTEICRAEAISRLAPALAGAASQVGSPQIRNRGTIGGNVGNASPAGDTLPALLAYGAVVELARYDGRRRRPLKEFFQGPGRTVLEEGELITGFSLAIRPAGQAAAFEKMGKRKALSISVVNAAVLIEMEAGAVVKARIALGAVAATVRRMTAAEHHLKGTDLSDGAIAQAAQLVSDAVNPIDDVRSEAAYRKQIAGVLTRRALETCRRQLNDQRE
ncbi:MAG TPA: xanthine dehydrogenase family protein subunit M [Patescibacteria group bacterium]|nr:xanthine dehydrogenase family protein subunit M [Patescibacteria group bacterium]